jgi:hypothetical protein
MEYIIFTENPSINTMHFNPSIPIIETTDIHAYVESIETKNGSKYRYYAVPGIYQRDKGIKEIESIMTLDRFSKNWYLEYPKMEVTTASINDEELYTSLVHIADDLFVNVYPKVVKILKDNYCSIISIDLLRDNIGITDIIFKISDKEGNDGTVLILRKE